MKPKALVVYLEGRRIGVLSEDRYGNHAFTYDMDAEIDASLSLSLPRRLAPWTGVHRWRATRRPGHAATYRPPL